MLLRPGERSAVDGSVIEGQSEIDQSLITGETLPVKAGPGTAVYAGTLNSPARCACGCRRRPKARCWPKSAGCSTTRCRRAPATCGWRIVRRGSMRPWSTPTALLTMLGWVAFGAILA